MLGNENGKIITAALKGFSWNVAGNFTRSISGFAINIILARLLGPEPFGIVALALLVVGIGNLIIDSGLGSALVQQKEITPGDIAFVFTLQMGFSIALTVLVISLAPWLAIQFSTPDATLVLQVMSMMLVLQAFAQVPSAMLRRELNFKRLQMAQITSFFVGYVGFGLPMAWAGLGVWSLVTAQVVQSGLNAIMVYFFSWHSLSLKLKGSRYLTLFGIRVLAANIANWLIQYLDQVIIGRQFGAVNLGFYSRAYFLNSTPLSIVVASAQASLFSAVSRMGKSEETRQFFLSFMYLFAIIFFPSYWLVALESSTIIQIIYGQEWMPSAALLTPLAIAMPFLILMGLQGPVLNGLGRPGDETKVQWITALFALVVLLLSSTISITVTAWSIVIIYIFRFALLSKTTVRAMSIRWQEILHPTGIGLALGGLTILTWFLSQLLVFSNLHFILVVIVRISGVLLVWAILAWIKRDWLRKNLYFLSFFTSRK